MGLIKRLSDAVRGRQTVVRQETSNQLRVSALCSAYENLFPQANALVNEMIKSTPFGIGGNRARLAPSRTPELVKLQSPNEDMGYIDFLGSMFRMWLTEDELNVHVHKNKRGTVIGYSILPPNCRQPAGTNGKDYDTFVFYSKNGGMVTLTPEEVMTLRYSRSPRNMDSGVSPASATYIWSQIDDLFAQYQKAFFENGAVPATITFITARTQEDYEKKRQKLESGLKGASNRNKTIYVYRHMYDDESTRDEVEVKTIQGNNSTLAFGELIKIINDKLNKAFGVSNFILGDDSGAKYDNAELSRYQFITNVVHPALISFWSQFQHGLDKITGGLGYAIDFEIEIPELTERQRAKAEISKVHVENLTKLISAGSRPYAAVEALGLSEKWQSVADGIYSRALSANVPSQDTNKNKGGCQCDHSHDTKIITSKLIEPSATMDAVEVPSPVFTDEEKTAKTIYDELMKILTALFGAKTASEILENNQLGLEAIKAEIAKALIGEANEGANAGAVGAASVAVGANPELLKAAKDGGFKVSASFEQRMNERVDALVNKFTGDARETVRSVLTSSEGQSVQEIRKKLQEVMPRARAELIARNETAYSFRSGEIETLKNIREEYGIDFKLRWIAFDGACDICRAMNDKIVDLGQAFPNTAIYTNDDGEEVEVEWTHSEWNDNGETPCAHPNCRCRFEILRSDNEN